MSWRRHKPGKDVNEASWETGGLREGCVFCLMIMLLYMQMRTAKDN